MDQPSDWIASLDLISSLSVCCCPRKCLLIGHYRLKYIHRRKVCAQYAQALGAKWFPIDQWARHVACSVLFSDGDFVKFCNQTMIIAINCFIMRSFTCWTQCPHTVYTVVMSFFYTPFRIQTEPDTLAGKAHSAVRLQFCSLDDIVALFTSCVYTQFIYSTLFFFVKYCSL